MIRVMKTIHIYFSPFRSRFHLLFASDSPYIINVSEFIWRLEECERCMIIQVSPLAESRLSAKLKDQPGYFKLFYDTDGCGCDGIAVLLIVNEPDSDDIPIESSTLPFLINKQQQIYFEPNLRLQSENSFPCFRLCSDSMIYGSNVKVYDLRDTAEVAPQPTGWVVR